MLDEILGVDELADGNVGDEGGQLGAAQRILLDAAARSIAASGCAEEERTPRHDAALT